LHQHQEHFLNVLKIVINDFVHQVNDQIEIILFDFHQVLFVDVQLYLDENQIENVVIVIVVEDQRFLQFCHELLREIRILMWIFV
jgi:hypothetical protein